MSNYTIYGISIAEDHVVRLSKSPGNSSTSAISLGSPIIAPSTLTKEPILGITYSNGYEII